MICRHPRVTFFSLVLSVCAVAAAPALALLTACSGSSNGGSAPLDGGTTDVIHGDPGTGSCDSREKDGVCTDFTGTDFTVEWVQSICSGTFSTRPCDRTDAVGQCRRSPGNADESRVVYYEQDQMAINGCIMLDGKWTSY